MQGWEEYFEIKEVFYEDGDFGSRYTYSLIIRATGEVIGNYRDIMYAKKQARHKYKKISKKIERILLS